MKFPYQLHGVLGSVYKGGNVVFTSDGKFVLSPVGNRINCFDLVNHRCVCLDACTSRDIAYIALSPNNQILLAIDVEGGALFLNFVKRVPICTFHFKKPVSSCKFSPDSKLFAVTHGRHIQLWKSPPLITQFRPLTLLRTLTGHYDEVLTLDWSSDGHYLLSGSADMTARVHYIINEHTAARADDDEKHQDEKATHSLDVSAIDADQTPASSSSSSSSSPSLPSIALSGHRGPVLSCFFGQPSTNLLFTPLIYTVSSDGALFVWTWKQNIPNQIKTELQLEQERDIEEQRKQFHQQHQTNSSTHHLRPKQSTSIALFGECGHFDCTARHYFNQNHAKVVCCSMHCAKQLDLLVVGFSSGVFGLYELPDFNLIHTLSISVKQISTVSINPSGQWLAFGCQQLGQLLVWEWQSETYVLKQQGHYFDVNCLSFSPDGQVICSGGDDGKVKLWNTNSGFCFITFANHTAPVTSVVWSPVGNVVLTSSLDGTVRAFDLVRYRNFRTLTTPQPAQLTSLAVDPAGEIVCAGSMDPFEIYVWSLQSGRLLDVLAGHEAPLSGLSFSNSLLASSSWDKTVRLWDVFSGKGLMETFTHGSDVLCVSFRPDGKELCSGALDGQLYFWDVQSGNLKGVIEGKKDIMGGRRLTDARAANNATHSTAFTSVCYSADGRCVLAGGNSRFVCIYEIQHKILLRKFTISSNLSMDGVLDILNSKRMTDGGPVDLIDDDDEREDDSLPGARRGDLSRRSTRLAVRSKCVRFSPTGMQWAAASTEGIMLYGIQDNITFDPTDLDVQVTPQNVQHAINNHEYAKAMVMSLSLNDVDLILQVLENTRVSDIPFVVQAVPTHRLQRLLDVLCSQLSHSAHLEFLLSWSHHILSTHHVFLKQQSHSLLTTYRHLIKVLTQQHKDVAKLCHSNLYSLDYLSQLAKLPKSTPSTS